MSPHTGDPIDRVLDDVYSVRVDQNVHWGYDWLRHPDGTGPRFQAVAETLRMREQDAAGKGTVTWQQILDAETAVAFEQTDPARLREQLLRVAATAVAWCEALDRRTDS